MSQYLSAGFVESDPAALGNDSTRHHPEIPREAVELLRHSVTLHDHRDAVRPERVAALLAGLRRRARPWAETPMVFPYSEPAADALPAAEAGLLLRAPTVRAAYLRLLWHVQSFGRRGGTQHSSDQREILDMLTVVSDEPAEPARFSHAEWMPFTRASLGERLHLTAYFRSHDVYRAWASNAYGLRALQGEISAAIGAGAGEVAILSHSARIYAHDWARVDELPIHYRVARDGFAISFEHQIMCLCKLPNIREATLFPRHLMRREGRASSLLDEQPVPLARTQPRYERHPPGIVRFPPCAYNWPTRSTGAAYDLAPLLRPESRPGQPGS